MGVWRFIQDQVLGMRWLNELIGGGLSCWGWMWESEWEEAFSFSSMTC